MTIGMFPYTASAAVIPVTILSSNTAAQNQKLIQDAIGLAGAGDTITVIGNATANAILKLNIPDDITVQWEAAYSGTANPVVDLTGEGNFNVVVGGVISNTSANSYTAIRANASPNNNEGIKIAVNGGTVSAVLGSAIEGAGSSTTVTITAGEVFNNATHNLRPVINMTNDSNISLNVTVTGGEVSARADSAGAYGYGIQTYGNVVVSGTGVVFTNGDYGRGINLTGVNSIATINSGATIYATGSSGVAISTATTAGVDVTNAQVIVNGGLVYANTGMAIRTTGRSSTVTVNGGLVIAYGTGITGNNNVIFTQNNAAEGFLGTKGPPNNGIVVAWNVAAAATVAWTYTELTAGHIIVWSQAGLATAVWDNTALGDGGINYINAGNTGTVGFGVNPGLIAFHPVNVTAIPQPPIPEYTIRIWGESYSPSNPSVRAAIGPEPYGNAPPYSDGMQVTVPEGGSITIPIGATASNYVYSVYYYRVGDNPLTQSTYVPPEDTCTFTNVTHDMVLRVVYASKPSGVNNIVAFAGEGGRITDPSHSIVNPRTVKVSDTVIDFTVVPLPATFNIIADGDFIISDVRVNSVSVLTNLNDPDVAIIDGTPERPSIAEYTFTATNVNVTGFNVITATFQKMYRINVSHNSGGIVAQGIVDIDAPSVVWANDGDDLTLRIVPDSGYRIGSVQVDGNPRSIPANAPYIQFPSVDGNHNIIVTFVQEGGGGGGDSDLIVPNPRPNEPGGSKGDGDVSHLLNMVDHMGYVQGVGDGKFEPDRNMTRAEIAQMFFNLLWEKNVQIIKRFPDEPDSAWHERAVHTLASIGVLTGYPDGDFHPNAQITRAEFVTIAARFMKEMPEAGQSVPFNDVPTAHWAYKYINAAVQYGWVTGYGDGSFQPDRHISRAEAVTIVNRMLNRVADKAFINSHHDLNHFDDVPGTHWAFYDIMEAYDFHDYERHDGVEEWMDR